jgi:predicted ABC-type transport system involved in lysophospholipase L1 biosynthesis ATPase subunit
VSAAVELVGVSKDYHGLRPLRIERLTVDAGERVALVGMDAPSAEVLVNLLTGASLPDAGEIRLFGRSTADIGDSAEWLALVDRFGLVTERAVLLDDLDVLQNLAVPFTLDIEPVPPDVAECAVRLAAEVGLDPPLLRAKVSGVDAAARVRVRLARALALQPSVLVLEHASAGLTRDGASALARTARAAAERRGAALIALTADDRFGAVVADRVLRWQPGTGALIPRRAGWFGR